MCVRTYSHLFPLNSNESIYWVKCDFAFNLRKEIPKKKLIFFFYYKIICDSLCFYIVGFFVRHVYRVWMCYTYLAREYSHDNCFHFLLIACNCNCVWSHWCDCIIQFDSIKNLFKIESSQRYSSIPHATTQHASAICLMFYWQYYFKKNFFFWIILYKPIWTKSYPEINCKLFRNFSSPFELRCTLWKWLVDKAQAIQG